MISLAPSLKKRNTPLDAPKEKRKALTSERESLRGRFLPRNARLLANPQGLTDTASADQEAGEAEMVDRPA
jgi:hypothetical protein